MRIKGREIKIDGFYYNWHLNTLKKIKEYRRKFKLEGIIYTEGKYIIVKNIDKLKKLSQD